MKTQNHISKTIIYFIFALFFTTNIVSAAGFSWQLVGTAGFSGGYAEYQSLAIDGSGTPFVAYQDGANSGATTVMKYDGTEWVAVGTAGFSAGSASFGT